MSRKLYRFHWDCGRMGDLEGLFIAEQGEVDELIGDTLQFGECLGKHSDIYGELQSDHITVISEDSEKVDWLFELLGSSVCGYSPFDSYHFEE